MLPIIVRLQYFASKQSKGSTRRVNVQKDSTYQKDNKTLSLTMLSLFLCISINSLLFFRPCPLHYLQISLYTFVPDPIRSSSHTQYVLLSIFLAGNLKRPVRKADFIARTLVEPPHEGTRVCFQGRQSVKSLRFRPNRRCVYIKTL